MTEHAGDLDADPLPWQSRLYLATFASWGLALVLYSLRVFADLPLPPMAELVAMLIGYALMVLYFIGRDGTG